MAPLIRHTKQAAMQRSRIVQPIVSSGEKWSPKSEYVQIKKHITEPVKNWVVASVSLDALQNVRAFRIVRNIQTLHEEGFGTENP